MSKKLDIERIEKLLAETHECDEKIADRGPVKVLPRPAHEIPDVPKLRARIETIKHELRVVRKQPGKPTGHDLRMAPDGVSLEPVPGRDFAAVGTIEEVRHVKKGQDRALPNTAVLVRVRFPAGEHLYFDPDDLVCVDRDSEASRP